MALTADDYNAKVLEMKFNNAAFEKNIQQSMNSLDRFQTVLDNLHGGQAFDQISKAAGNINLGKIESALDAIKNRFTDLGIVGATMIYRLTNSFINFGKKLWDISLGQMSSGGWTRALNIQQAEFMLKGLGLNVNEIRDNALAAVKGTAYGFDEAARAAASFGASGVEAGEDMEKALMGVAGVAAMTGSSFADIADVFTTVASQGRLMTNELTRLSYRGLNVSSVLAQQLGKSEAQIHEMVHKGQIDFKQFSNAMTEAFGKHAKDANKTFTGSISNIKAALSRIGADFASPIANDTIPALNSLIDVIDSIHESMSPVINVFKTWSGILSNVFNNLLTGLKDSKTFSNIFNGIRNLFVAFIVTLDAVRQAFSEIFPQIGGLSNAFRLLTAYLIPTEEGYNGLVNTFKILFAVFKMVVDGFKTGAKIFLFVGQLCYRMLDYVLKLAAGIGDLIDPYIQWIKENNVIENILYVIITAVYEFIIGSELLKKAFDAIVENWGTIKGFFSGLGTALLNVGNFVVSFVSSIDMSNLALASFIVTLAFTAESVYQFGKRMIVTFGGFLYTVWNIFKQIGNVFLNLSRIFNQVWQILKLSTYEALAGVILKSALSILVLAAALKVIADIPQEDLIKAGIAMALLAGALIGMVAAFTALYCADNLFKAFGVGVLTAFVLSVTTGLVALSFALKVIGSIDSKDIFKAVAALYAIGILLVAMNKLTSIKFEKGTFFKTFSGQLLSLAASVAIIAVSLKLLSSIENRLGAAIGALTMISFVMVILSKMAATTKDDVTALKPSLFSQLAASMLLLSLSIRILADIKDPQSLENALGALAALAAGIVIISYIQSINGFGTIKTSGFIQMAATLSVMSLCLVALSLCATLPNGALVKGILALYSLEAAISLMMWVSESYTKVETSGFIKLSATLLIMTGCLSMLALICAVFDPQTLENAVGCIFVLELALLAMAGIQKVFSLGGIDSKGFLAFAASLVLMTSALTVLSLLDADKVKDGLFAIIVLTAVVSAMMILSDTLSGIKSSGFVLFATTILILSGSIAILAKSVTNPDALLLSIGAIAALTAITYQFVKMSQDMKNIHTLGFVTFAASILILAGAVAVLALLPDSSKMVDAAVAVGALVIAMSVAAQLAKDFSVLAGGGLAIMAAGVLLLAGAVAILAGIEWERLAVATATIVVLMVALDSITSAGLNPAGAAGLIILSGAILLMATSLLILSGIPWPALLVGGGVIALLTLSLVAAGNASMAAIPGLLSLAATLVTVALVVVAFGAGVKLLADAFVVFTNGLHNLATLSKDDVAQIMSNISDLCDGIIGMAPKLALAAGAVGVALGAALGVISISLSSYAMLGVILFAYMLVASAPILLDAFGKLMDATGDWFDEHGDQVYEFGEQVGRTFMDGVLGGLTGISEAIYDKTFGAETQEYMEQMAELEKGAMSKGAENMIAWMDMYNAGQTSAEQMVAGLKAGLENGYMTNDEVMRELAARGLSSFNDELGIHSPSREMEKSGQNTVLGVIEGVVSGEESLNDAMAELGQGASAAFTSNFNTDTLLGGFNTSTGGKDWYEEGNKWVAGDYAYKRAGFDTIDDYVSEMTERERMRKYKDIVSGFEDMNPLSSLSDGLENATKGLGNFSGAAGTASKKTDKLKESIKSALDVFSEFNEKVGTTGRSVLQNFMKQMNGVTKWSKELQALSERGLNANFLVDLADQGPAAYDKIHALYTMTEKELTLFNQMYAQKISLQKDTVKSIRDSFVKNGAMTKKEAAEYGKKIAEATASGVESGSSTLSSSMTKTETKAAQDAAEEAKRQKIDDAFVAKWAASAGSESTKLAMSEAFTDLGLASMAAFKQSMNFEVILDQLILFKNGIKDQVRSALNLFDEVEYKTNQQKKSEEYSTQQMLYNMTENAKKVGRWATNIQKLSERGLSEGLVDQLRQLGPEGAAQIDAFVRMSDKELKKANAVYASSLKLDEYTSDKITSAYSKAGYAVTLGLKKSLKDGKDDLLFAYQETGEDVAEGFVKGVNPDAAREVMKFLGENSLESLKTALDSHSPSRETEKIGMDTTEGYIIGITSPSRLAEAMSSLATMTLDMFSQLLGPDKFKIMGLDCIDGFARGIIEGLQTKTQDILNMFTISMLGINENLKDPDNSIRVNIIPVVDQNALDGTSVLMNDYFGNKRFDISASVNRANAANKTNNQNNEQNILIDAIRGLREDVKNIKNTNEAYRTDIGSLKDAISSMKVTLDTGALVGQITNPLDAALGTKAMRSLRRRG